MAFVARQIARQLKILASQLKGICDGDDIEAVHRCRVASRRLRVALAMLGDIWDAKQVKHWKIELQHITRDLGEARDHDVQIETLTGILADGIDKTAVLGVSLLLAEVTTERCWLQRRVLSAVDRFKESEVLTAVPRAIKRARAGKKGVNQASATQFQTRIGKRVAKQYAELEANADALSKPNDNARHHAMRISAKRLRYALEIARGLFAADLESPIAEAKRAQTLLGEVHDCDVWLERLDEFIQKELVREKAGHANRGHGERLRVGIDLLGQQFTENRNRAFSEFVELWKQWQADHFWTAFLGDLGPRASPARRITLE
jgi:CHAD domain-containing protein